MPPTISTQRPSGISTWAPSRSGNATGADSNAAIDVGATPIFVACQNGCHKVVQLLLAAGADPNTPMNNGSTPLIVASQNGYYQIVELLLAAGADGSARHNEGFTPLYAASQNGHHQGLKSCCWCG